MLKASIVTLVATAIAATTAAGAYAQQPKPLSADELAQCAAQIQRLRAQSPPLNRRAKKLDARRQQLRVLAARIKANNRANAATDKSLQPWIKYNAKAKVFNRDMAKFRADVLVIDHVKRDYQAHCANHPYRRKEFDRLPAAARQAMRAGLSDIRVPYTTDNTESQQH